MKVQRSPPLVRLLAAIPPSLPSCSDPTPQPLRGTVPSLAPCAPLGGDSPFPAFLRRTHTPTSSRPLPHRFSDGIWTIAVSGTIFLTRRRQISRFPATHL